MQDQDGQEVQGIKSKVTDELISAFCRECSMFDPDDSHCHDHDCYVHRALGPLLALDETPPPIFVYVSRNPCGCTSGAFFDRPEYRADCDEFIAQAIRDGLTVERVPGPVSVGAEMCEDHRAVAERSG